MPARVLKIASLLALAAGLVAAPARAQAPATPTTTIDSSGRGPGYVGDTYVWGQIGFYTLGISVSSGGFSASASTTNFGLGVGGAKNLLPLAQGLNLAAYVDLNVDLATGSTAFPVSIGALARYDGLPVHLAGGLGFTAVFGSFGDASTPLGVDIMLQGAYPLASVMKNLSAQAQFHYHILSNSFSLWSFTIGAGYGF